MWLNNHIITHTYVVYGLNNHIITHTYVVYGLKTIFTTVFFGWLVHYSIHHILNIPRNEPRECG